MAIADNNETTIITMTTITTKNTDPTPIPHPLFPKSILPIRIIVLPLLMASI
ncbi:MAG: hypothetical protein RLZZ204_1362 [Bacteroidota bacterium]|jgi:hypothetical protein